MKKHARLMSGVLTAMFLLTSFIPNAMALTVIKTTQIIDTSIIRDYKDIYIDEIGIDTTYPQYFYADVCTTGMTAEGVVINYNANGIDKTMELNLMPENDCKRYYSWAESYFQLDEGDSATLKVTIDYYDDFAESNETNNVETGVFTVPTTTVVVKPDLYISEIGVTADYTQFYAKVCGLNTDDLSTVGVKFSANVRSTTNSVTAPDSDSCVTTYVTISSSFSGLVKGTQYTLQVDVDPSNAISEEDETNNSSLVKFTIPGTTVDLKLSDVGLSDDGAKFYATVCGDDTNGVGTVKLNFNANNYDNEITITAPGDGVCTTFYSWGTSSFSLVSGNSYTLTAIIDSDQEVTEANENNNVLTTSFSTESDPVATDDLYISEIGTDLTTSSFYAKVCSSTTTASGKVVSLNFNANNYNDTVNVTAPGAGNCSAFSSSAFSIFGISSTVDKSYTLTAKIDYGNVLAESNETNNTLSATVSFSAEEGVDLYVNSISTTEANDYLTVVIGNKGEEDMSATAGAYLYIYIDEQLEWTYSVSTLADQSFRNAGSTSKVQPQVLEGTHTIKACLYPDSSVGDTNSSNDCMSKTVTSASTSSSSTYDFWIKDMGVESDYTNLYMTVCSDSDTTSSKFVYVNFNANGHDNALGITTPTNGNCSTTYSWGISNFYMEDGKSYTVKGTVDSYSYVAETDENNNTYSFTATMPSDTQETNDELLFKPSVMLLMVGDFDGQDSDTKHNYQGLLESNNTGLIKVEPIAEVLFENPLEDAYTETTAGADFDMTIYNHWDGILFYVYPTSTSTSERSLDLGIDGYVNEVIMNTDDLKAYSIGDGTDNKVQLKLVGYLNDDATEDDKDKMIENFAEIAEQFSFFGEQMEEESDDDVKTKFQDLIDFSFYMPVAESDSATASVIDMIDVETPLLVTQSFADSEDVIKDTYLNPFNDVAIDEWYGEYVKDIQDKGIISGYKDANGNLTGEFKPGNNVTVAEALKIVLEATGQGESDRTPNLPSAANHWAGSYVAMAEDLGMSIVDDSALDLNRQASRAEIIKMLFEALEVEVPSYTESSFSDGSQAGSALSSVEYAKDMGIVSGYADGNFGYTSSINRAEVAKIITEAIDILGL